MTTSTVNECQSSTLLTAENYKFSLMDLACNYVASIHGAAVLVIQDLKEKGLESKDFNTRIVSLPRFEYKKSVFLIDSHWLVQDRICHKQTILYKSSMNLEVFVINNRYFVTCHC